MQTAGFSDTDLQNIFRHGTTPNGALAQPLTNITYQMWQSFHQWQVVDEAEAQGLVIYLRSITPAPTGNADFGGAFGQGGARPKGDGGTKPPRPNDGG
jgi:hypothetical protein